MLLFVTITIELIVHTAIFFFKTCIPIFQKQLKKEVTFFSNAAKWTIPTTSLLSNVDDNRQTKIYTIILFLLMNNGFALTGYKSQTQTTTTTHAL
jgi:hypothetical protein